MNTCFTTLALTAAATGLLVATLGPKPVPRFVWNASESVPIGLYRLQPADRLIVTDLVVAFLPGQTVCREKLTITVDGIDMGAARKRDRRGRVLPSWQGCRVLAQGEVFLMNWDEPASLDSRYFGPLPVTAIVGRAVPLWTFEEE
jgi:type IV secretory pathway protease TraF